MSETSVLGHVQVRWRDDERAIDLRVHDAGVDDDGVRLYAVHVSRDVARSIFSGAASVSVAVLPARSALQVEVGDETDGVLT